MKRKTKQLATIAAAVILGWNAPSQAAIIVWNAASTIAGDSDVSTTGTTLYAARFYAGTGASLTINGVTFTDPGSNVTWAGPKQNGMGFPTETTGDYATFLASDSYDIGNPNTLTLNGLTIGEKYQVQLWSNDSRGGAHNQLVAFSAGKRTLLNRNTAAAGGPGQWVTGIFMAEAVTQAITVSPHGSGGIAINGLQVRTLPKDFAAPTADARTTVQETTILAKPLREQNRLELPTAPMGYRWEIVATTPSDIIARDGTLRRTAHDTDVAVTLRLRHETTAADTAEVTLTVPIDRPYVAPEVNEAAVRTARERYERQKYGLFVHYVPGLTADPKGGHPGIDELVRRFDAARFAQDAKDFGVEYVIFTVMHFQARTLYPSAVNKRWRDDRRAPVQSGQSAEGKSYSDDDLIDRVATELAKRNIDLHLYVHPVDGHDFPVEDQDITGWNDCDLTQGDHARWNQFQNELFDELVQRYQGRIKGLWFDGMFQHSQKQPGHSGIDQPRFRKTLLAYDPSLVLLANVSSDRRPDPSPDWAAADYRAWEVSSAEDGWLGFVGINPKATDADPLSWPATRNQVAMIIGSNWWAQSKKSMVRQSPENLARYIAHQASLSTHGGFAMSAGIFPGTLEEQGNGNLWEGDFHPTMLALARLLEPVAIAIKDTHPGRAYVTKEREWVEQRPWGVSTESPDRRTVYLHVLRPPTARVLALGPTEDGTELDITTARLVKGGASVPMRKNDSGYEIALPKGAEWDAVNTVIAVRRR